MWVILRIGLSISDAVECLIGNIIVDIQLSLQLSVIHEFSVSLLDESLKWFGFLFLFRSELNFSNCSSLSLTRLFGFDRNLDLFCNNLLDGNLDLFCNNLLNRNLDFFGNNLLNRNLDGNFDLFGNNLLNRNFNFLFNSNRNRNITLYRNLFLVEFFILNSKSWCIVCDQLFMLCRHIDSQIATNMVFQIDCSSPSSNFALLLRWAVDLWSKINLCFCLWFSFRLVSRFWLNF